MCMAKIDERHVLRVIHDHGPSSRTEVVRCSGLSAPTLSKAAAALEQAGLLDEIEGYGSVIGRPAMKLRLANASAQVRLTGGPKTASTSGDARGCNGRSNSRELNRSVRGACDIPNIPATG
jgi:hypothetical protein